ncbi:MAG: hypothetical protein S4CHLAM45_03360 [Chlamydiales bacterium]|nr:hypothetical protein [Chlamydiales bacterium]MCH9619192.1 hypothetical protein [Chlamydiales bacterium]MCH9622454.1 hypothetical protein [Chlamydiales bacterium]
MSALWIVDMQEKLFSRIDRHCEVLETICFFLEAANILNLPIVVTEQYPEGLGGTLKPILDRLPKGQQIWSKTTFSGYLDPTIRKKVETLSNSWILVGVEAHICVLQTAKDLLADGKEVTILNDAISSRSLYDFSTALAELKEAGARITSSETLLYELVRDANSPLFKKILPLVKRDR